MAMAYPQLVALIRNAGRRPVERNSLYEAVRDAFDDPPPSPVAESRRRALPVVHAA
jgi:hypothetical protein